MASRVRIYTLANELGLSSKELIPVLTEEGIEAKSHMSTIDEETATLVREHVLSERAQQQGADTAESKPSASTPEATRESSSEREEAATDAESGEEKLEEEEEEEDEEEVAENEVHLTPPIVVRDLADEMGMKPNVIISELMMMNVFATINQAIPPETAEKICQNHGFELVQRKKREKKKVKGGKKELRQERKTEGETKRQRKPVGRPPVVACLGHVDHGKTALLDKIRKTNATTRESGGITQHVGASVISREGHNITFLDTPGHEAFTTMRLRGANATDIVILVVAADDGVMPQTVEAINHAKAAGVSIVVAANKMDLPGADEQQVLLGLQQQSLTPEQWGGEIGVIPVSAQTGEGIDELLERVELEAEMLELTADPSASCEGIVIEGQKETGKGSVATMLVQEGTLRVGDIILCNKVYGRVRALIDQSGKRIKSAGPSCPVQVLGLSEVPQAGEKFSLEDSEQEAKMAVEERLQEEREEKANAARESSLEDIFSQLEAEMGSKKELPLIVKADVQGSVEAILENLNKLESEKIELNILHSGIGEITENDLILAKASNAVILGFHVRASASLRKRASKEGIELRLYSVIYELLDEVQQLMRGQLEPETKETYLGTVEIREVFHISRVGKICGSYVTDGVVRVGNSAKVNREGQEIYNGQIKSLRRFKDDVREVRQGYECGIKLDNFEDFEVGDRIKVYAFERVTPEL